MANDLLFQAQAFPHASDITRDVWDALEQNEPVANIIHAFARKAMNFPRGGDKQLWISLYDEHKNVAFVLSCTKGPMGNYPIFIVPCRPSGLAGLAQEGDAMSLADAMSALAERLLQEVPPQRVFSVFSIENVTRAFAAAFVSLMPQGNGIRARVPPYYEAALSACTAETFVERPDDLTLGKEGFVIALRRADILSDLDGVKHLCKGFSETSPPYELDDERAALEARTLIENEEVWVHTMEKHGRRQMVSLVAATRKSAHVTAITKVFMDEAWRGNRCSMRLLHRACQDILADPTMQVVLYVGIGEALEPARKVYRKVGFQGLDEERIQRLSDTEKWLEIGFEGTELGYW